MGILETTKPSAVIFLSTDTFAHRASLEPGEPAEVIRAIRSTGYMLGDGIKRVMPCEEKNRLRLRKNIVAARSVIAGTELVAEDIRVVRTGGKGLTADRYQQVLGRITCVPLTMDEPINEDMLAGTF